MAFSSWTGAAAVTSHSQVWWECPCHRHSRPLLSPIQSPSVAAGPASASLQGGGTVLLLGKLLQKPLDSKHPNVPWSLPRNTATQGLLVSSGTGKQAGRHMDSQTDSCISAGHLS